jgi:2',3'-cyclic-nucleotide 2'-phosphodiesterase/3'-nucleotidase
MVNCNTYTVQRGDTLSEIGEWFHVDWRDLAKINHIDNPDLIRPGQVIKLTSSPREDVCNVHMVKQGDTLSEIGEHFHVPWQRLAHYNHIENPDLIHPGETVCIPHG